MDPIFSVVVYFRCPKRTFGLKQGIYAFLGYFNVNIYAVLYTSFSTPNSSQDWLLANPGHGTKFLTAPRTRIAGNLNSRWSCPGLLTPGTSRCVILSVVTD